MKIKKRLIFFILLLIVTFKLFYNYQNLILIFDESSTLLVTEYPLKNFIKTIVIQENGPCLYQAGLKIFRSFTDLTYYNYRIPSIIFGIFSFVLGFSIVKKMAGYKSALFFFVIFLTSVYYQDFFHIIKPYPLVILLTYINLWWYIYKFDKNNINKIIQSLFLAAGIYTAYYFSFFMIIFILLILFNKKFKDFIFILLLPGIFFLPWLFIFIKHLTRVTHKYWVEPVYSAKILSAFYWFSSSNIFISSTFIFIIIIFLFKKRTKILKPCHIQPLLFIIFSLLIPFIFFILAYLNFNIYYYRYFVGCALFFYIGLSCLSKHLNKYLFVLISIFLLVSSYYSHEFYYLRHKDYFKLAVDYIKNNYNPKTIYHSNVYSFFSFKYIMPKYKHFISLQKSYPHYNAFILISQTEYFDIKKKKPEIIVCRRNAITIKNRKYLIDNYSVKKMFGRLWIWSKTKKIH